VYSSPDLPHHNRYHERDLARDLDAERGLSAKRSARPPQRRPSIIKRLFRFFIAILLGVAATLGWQSHGEEATQMVAAWSPALAELLPVPPTKSPTTVGMSSGLGQQLEPVARELAIVRRSLDQLAAKQEQMALSIATLHAGQPSTAAPSWAAPMLPSRPQQPAAKSASPSPPPARQPMVMR
jgi:hypothetical protein